jgi:hypothetical protein
LNDNGEEVICMEIPYS